MTDTYLMHNGKRIELTDEQKKQLGVEDKSPFERVKVFDDYFHIDDYGNVCECTDKYDEWDELLFSNANYCTDKELIEQRALHETLNRRLWRFSCENGELDNPWAVSNVKWYIASSFDDGFEKISPHGTDWHRMLGIVYFPTKEIAKRAIEEIVKPFMETHPEFLW